MAILLCSRSMYQALARHAPNRRSPMIAPGVVTWIKILRFIGCLSSAIQSIGDSLIISGIGKGKVLDVGGVKPRSARELDGFPYFCRGGRGFAQKLELQGGAGTLA